MKVLFVVVCAFPLGDATSIRAINLVRLLSLGGYQVHVISDVKGTDIPDLPCSYEFINEFGSSSRERKKNALNSIKRVAQYLDTHQVDFVLINARYDRFNKIADICHKRNIPLIVENCEWYNCESFKLRKADYRYYLNQKMLIHDFKKANGFISISRLLDEHNSAFGIPSVRIPTIMDVQNTEYRVLSKETDKICIVYTGNPRSSKEYLAPMVNILASDAALKEKIEFHIYGADKKQVLKNKGVTVEALALAGSSVIIHGKIPQAEIQHVLLKADYQLFLRPNRKSSNAGFPTKLGESMAVGTPVITNDTGDISLYLKDGENGFLVEDNTTEALRKTIRQVVKLSSEDYEALRKSARRTAAEHFDYRQYVSEIKKVL